MDPAGAGEQKNPKLSSTATSDMEMTQEEMAALLAEAERGGVQ